MRLAGHVTWFSKLTKVYRVLVEKPERKRLFGRPRASWDNNTKMVLK
jgi:hypothetical protein